MNVIIAIDSLKESGYILDDLSGAGLPPDTSFLIVSATDIDALPQDSESAIEEMLMPDSQSWQREISPEERTYLATMLENARSYSLQKEAEMTENATAAAAELQQRFPGAAVEYKVIMGSPFEAIAAGVKQTNADLIILGSQNASTLTRFFLGSVSQKVLNFATRPVRIARAQAKRNKTVPRLMIAFDGSPDSRRAVTAVARRAWPAGTQSDVITVDEPRAAGSFLRSLLGPTDQSAGDHADSIQMVHKLANEAVEQLTSAGLVARHHNFTGDPKKILLEQAEQQGTDVIFLGAKGHQNTTVSTLGAVATALATRAHCSMEVIR